MSHKPNLLSWDQDGAASPRELHETDNNRTNSADLLVTWQYFSFRHIRFSKLLSHQKLSQISLSYFSNALPFEQGKRSFQISGKLSSFAKITKKNRKALDNIDLNLVSHRYVSGVLKDDHFVSACSRAPRFWSLTARIISVIKRSIDLSSLYH